MATAVNYDLFTRDVIQDPYTYFGRLREEDPVHFNELYEMWFITRYDDLVWLTRHPELFSNAVFKNDPRLPAPAIEESDLGLYEYVRDFFGSFFIQHDRPEHADMRKVVHHYFNPKAMELWRPLVIDVINGLLDEAEAKGSTMSCTIWPSQSRYWSLHRCWACPIRTARSSGSYPNISCLSVVGKRTA
jgi:cytochrome P450